MANYPRAKSKPDDIATRWSGVIADNGWSALPNCIVFCQSNLGISSVELNILVQLIAVRFTVKNPYASAELLANRMGKSKKSVRVAIAGLERKGLIKRLYVTGRPNFFDFAPLVHRLENHTCINPIRKRTPPYPKSAIPPRTKTTTKEEDLKKNIKRNGGVNSIGEIMAMSIQKTMSGEQQTSYNERSK